MADISDKNASLPVKIVGAASDGTEQTPVQSTDEGALHAAFNAIVDTNNAAVDAVLPAYLGTPFESLIVPGSALPSIPADTWAAAGWTSVKNFAGIGFTARATGLGRGFAIWSNDGGATVSRYESTLFAGAGAFTDPPQGATHLKVAFQNLTAVDNTFNLSNILRYQSQGAFMSPVSAPLDPSFPAASVKAVIAGQKPDKSFGNVRIQGSEPTNTTTTPLGSSEVFRGLWFNWQENYIKLLLDVSSDTSGTIFIDFSQSDAPVDGDESSVTESFTIFYNPSSTPLLRRHVPVQSKWVRIRYQNDVTAQTRFVLDTSFAVTDPGLTMLPLEIQPTPRNLAGIIRSVLTIPEAAGGAFTDVPVSALGNPKQSVAEIHDDILIEPLSSAAASQTLLGTTPTQIDSAPLANRRVASVYNEGPLRVAVGHTPGMTFDSESIRIPPGSTRTFGVDAGVPLYGVCENLGGIQTTLNRSPSSASGTATNPNNVTASDNVYANITANGQTINATGYTAGTTNAIASIRLGIEANRPSGITNTVAFQESRTGSASGLSAVSTTATVTGIAGHLYVAAISRRNKPAITAVTGVAGLGLTWSQLTTQLSDDSQRTLDIWYAIGTPSGNSVVTASFDNTPINSHISVTRYSDVNPSTPFLDFKSATANDASPTTAALSGVNKGMAYMAVAGANRTMTAGSGYTLISSELTNAGGDSDSLSAEYKALTVGGSETPTGTLSGNAHWAAISLIINPSAAADPIVNLGYTLSAVPGATSGNLTVSSSSDQTQYVNITGDRSWVFGDIANVNVIVTGQTIGLVQANVDHVFIEVTDTTGNTSRVSLWQGGKAVT